MKNLSNRAALRLFLGVAGLIALLCGDVLNFMLLTIAASLTETSSRGMFASTLTPITKADCESCRAGIACLWATDCKNVEDITFDANRCVSGITMDLTQPTPVFTKIEFEKGTAFFNQEKVRNKNSVNVTQTIQFVEGCMNATIKNALQDLNECCCLHTIVKDNGGNYHYAGISYFHKTDEWQDEDMQTGEGSGNTGADPVADSNEYIESLTTNSVNWYAPFYKGGEAAIPV